MHKKDALALFIAGTVRKLEVFMLYCGSVRK